MSQLQTRSEKFNKKKVSVYDLCRFDVNLQDASGSIIGIIMDKEAEKLLSLTTDEIYDLASNEFFCREINSLLKLAFDFLSCIKQR
ncbi:uncharacterized protein LOC132044373 isoform X3 [Lycium ferocissimum]|uniref:uncharacterized protein LOC132044373 isoform X3 n=1 Tax=Lycium ferocissimum TaxID=112874 RepID=UPI002815F4C3|nr:uncharacterized protein LOC132044373 isoform X3 [Lycium ferocissimum]